MTLTLNLCTRKQDPSVNYNLFNQININEENVKVDTVNFHIPTLVKEVKGLKKSERRKLKTVAQTFITTSTSFLLLSSKSMANTVQSVNLNQVQPTTGTHLPTSGIGMPPELLELMLTILVIIVGAAIILSIIFLVLAGTMRFIPKRKKEASEWTVDIVKGLVQVLMAPAIVFLIYYLASKLFANSGWFISPF